MFALRRTLNTPSVFTTVHRFTTTVNLHELTTSAAYDHLTNTAGRERDFATVHHLLNRRYANGFFTTNNTFKFISTDLSSLDDLLKTISDIGDGHCRKASYDSLVARLCKSPHIDAAQQVADAAIGGKHGADACTFHPILSVLTRRKNFDESWGVMKNMRTKGIRPDVTCYNFMLTAYAVTGDLRSCAGVLKKMELEGLKADARTYDALVLGACKAGKLDGAILIMRRMLEDGVGAIHATYAHVIGSLVRLDYCAQAVKFVMFYAGKDRKLDTHNFELLATRLIANGKVDEAKYVLDEMVKRDLEMVEKLKQFYSQNFKSLTEI